MPYQYILANLLARNEGAVGVLFVDDSGETVDLACADFSPFQMRVVAAYVGIYLRQVQEFFGEMENGAPNWFHIEKDSLHIYVAPLPDGYFLVLVQRAPASRRRLAPASPTPASS
jgi:predicted regulator of Ras-like GTPase activity (Roadblock/LC7/MglB family)